MRRMAHMVHDMFKDFHPDWRWDEQTNVIRVCFPDHSLLVLTMKEHTIVIEHDGTPPGDEQPLMQTHPTEGYYKFRDKEGKF